jgi:tRNA U34 5-methylaminomethyl-2-thiouridine-forming methyltransferase MnmC
VREGDFELVTLRGGAQAVRDVRRGEVMHPAGGPWAEARRLYAEQLGVRERAAVESPRPLRVLDVGLGAAANAVAVLSAAEGARRAVELHSLEVDLAPLRLALRAEEAFPFLQPWRAALEALLARGEWAGGAVRWRLLQGDARETLDAVPEGQELVLFDPFSPKANPELWSPELLARVRARCLQEPPGALLATYSAATPTRVSLLLAGFYVGVGISTAGKRETTVAATRMDALHSPLGARWLERWRRSPSRAPHGQAFTEEIEARLLAHPQFAEFGQR